MIRSRPRWWRSIGSGDIREILSVVRSSSEDDVPLKAPLYGCRMWWGIGGGMAILWLVLLIVLGISCLRKGHWVLFILGIFLPLFWIIGAIIPPVRPQTI